MTFPPDLSYFKASEFDHPDLMDHAFLRWLDRVRSLAEVPFIVTSDVRPADVDSLHGRGRVVDLRSRHWTAVQKWHVAAAVFALADEAPGAVEFELVHGPTDQHVHLGVDDTPSARHELILAND